MVQMLRAMKSALPTERQQFFQALANVSQLIVITNHADHVSILQSNMLLALEGYFNNDCEAVRHWERQQEDSRRKNSEASPNETIESPETDLLFFESSSRCDKIHPLTLASELLYFSAGLHPQNVQQAIVMSALRSPSRTPTYWLALTNVLKVSCDKGVIIQITEVFKNVLSPNAFTTPLEKGDFVAIFFDRGVFNALIDILLTEESIPSVHDDDEDDTDSISALNIRLFAKAQIVSICRECAHLHQARSRYRVS